MIMPRNMPPDAYMDDQAENLTVPTKLRVNKN